MIVFLTADLMMASNANSHARQAGVTISQAASSESALAIIDENRPHMLLVDLQCPGLDIAELGKALSQLSDSQSPLSIAYAQHVETEKISAAKAAGFDQVLTRGQMNSQMQQIIAGAK